MTGLAGLPAPGARRVGVWVRPAAERHVRRGHPWVFESSIDRVSHRGQPGDLAVVFDRHRRFLAVGLYDPGSPIRVRVLHHGQPRPIGEDFWLDRIVAATDRRQALTERGDTTGYRLLNGEGDGVPGLVADVYDEVMVLKVYSAAWFAHLAPVVEVLDAVIEPSCVVVRLGRSVASPGAPVGDGEPLVGRRPTAPVVFAEHGLAFEADVVAGQKTGFFLDQRDNRSLVAGLARGARVLDVFCATGGFSVHAAAAGARAVVSVDASAPTLEAAERNMAMNRSIGGLAACEHRAIRGDAFAVMARLAAEGERFDVVVIDPPAFARRRDQVRGARRAYGRLTALGLGLVEPGEWLFQASCSRPVGAADFVETLDQAAATVDVTLRDAIVTGHALDHPVAIPENSYLKAVVARAESGGRRLSGPDRRARRR